MRGADPAILKQFIQESGLKFEQNSVSYIFTCPLCSTPKKLYLRKRDGRFVCWKCKETQNYQGRPEYALADLTGLPVQQIKVRLYGLGDIQVSVYLDIQLTDFFGDEDDVDEDATILTTTAWPLDYYPICEEGGERGAEYLRGRGIPPKLAEQYGIRYCPESKRVVFPVESHGQLYGWQERLIVDHHWVDEEGNSREVPKILSSKGLGGIRGQMVMFADRLDGVKHAVLGEGPVDAMKAHFCKGNISPMGKAVSEGQLRLILNAGVEALYLGLDPDAADEVQRIVRNHFDSVKLYLMAASVKGAKEKPDLGAMGFDDVWELFRGAPQVRAGQIFVFFDPRVA